MPLLSNHEFFTLLLQHRLCPMGVVIRHMDYQFNRIESLMTYTYFGNSIR